MENDTLPIKHAASFTLLCFWGAGGVYLSVLNGNGPLEDHFVNVAAGEEINGSLRITSCQNVVFCSSVLKFILCRTSSGHTNRK